MKHMHSPQSDMDNEEYIYF